ncbi:NAD-glutamate dehydrogenase [Magnetospirillum sp. UT-4]|uniref:NAD-glutamate dehydrogenase n=1 Tax=Magnetospirillum sp. UT-4 TaxID=2681467 RepID=UPI0013834AC3|nr:NAD-glutamate dehydrogenase [Magnetospirillum sp. UT-4]CAA7621849.1 NAD-specific glutamate dehydrogenase [Magnetospirillum sp. UT-4]
MEDAHDGLARGVSALARAALEPMRAARIERLARLMVAAGGEPAGLTADQLHGAALGLAGLLDHRPAGTALVRLHDADEGGAPRTVVEIVNDDMPFLVDSVAMAFERLGIAIHRLLHPVLFVRRDGAGRLDILAERDGDGLSAESAMHLVVDRLDPDSAGQLRTRLDGVLADLRRAVADWRSMADRLGEAARELADSGPGTGIAEAVAFLDWLGRDHFTFLGYRSFRFADGEDGLKVVVDAGAGLGLLADPAARVFDDAVPLAEMPAEVRAFLRRGRPLLVTKSAQLSAIHRPVRMDVIGAKRLGADGEAVGMHAFLGLFTAAAYTRDPAGIPLLRAKVAAVQARAGFPPSGHDAKALANILETFPRDELFQMSEDALYAVAIGILRLRRRPRPALFVRADEFGRFVSCLVFLPRDHYDTPLRLTVQALLERAWDGTVDSYHAQVGDSPLALLQVLVRTRPGRTLAAVDLAALEARIALAARSWPDRLQDALVRRHGEAEGLRLARLWRDGFAAGYRDAHAPEAALADLARAEAVVAGRPLAASLCRPGDQSVRAGQSGRAELRLLRPGTPVPLSDILPMLETMGVRVISEVPHPLRRADRAEPVWLQVLTVEGADGGPLDVEGRAGPFEETLARVWAGDAECDGFNRLVLAAGLDWRQVAVLRAYGRFLRQAGIAFGQAYMERALADNPQAASAILDLFLARFDPANGGDADHADAAAAAALETVEKADDDRILRRVLAAVRATLRTNFFQPAADGGPKPYLSIKIASRALDELPLPRPMAEIFVCSPRVEAIHLRGGKVARGGIRWSDRPEDFRTEILGLMKAQMVKNAVIVPVGAKGGFVLKRPPPGADRAGLLAEAVECYRTMMRGLLDLTDNLVDAAVVPPPAVVRLDGDDPYLVVAADKGTASFSDIANGISAEYGFWLGDAFASGGSKGYDHKAMGITARGAWEAVKRHFREMGRDTQAEDFTVVGVGDMSGDVFGNAMLLSPRIRLVGAFNHSHVFIDPDPDPAVALAERRRLFGEARAWPDYDRAALSPGGGVFARTAKSIPVSPEMAARFGITAATVTPAELIRILLTAEVDLLFFGGIGTYVKSARQGHAEAGDRANDALRVDAHRLRARVVGEGANLALTQAARIDYALAGGRINTDAIDNSAGVDTSDHEVNIKILLDGVVRAGDLDGPGRDRLLAAMTDEVAALVLRHNTLQTQALSVMEAAAADQLEAAARFMRLLEKQGRLDRVVEVLPDDEALLERATRHQGLVRPELAVLLAYAKVWLHDHLLASALPDDPFLASDLALYFPTPLRQRFAAAIAGHRLRREIVATSVVNSMINRVGIAFVSEIAERTGAAPAEVARAYIVVREAFGLRRVWAGIEALDGTVPAAAQIAMLAEANRLLDRAAAWAVRCLPAGEGMGQGIGDALAALAPGIAALEAALPAILPPDQAEAVAARAADYRGRGVPDELARQVADLIVLASAPEIIRIAAGNGLGVEQAGALYYAVGARFGLGWLRATAQGLAIQGHWQKLAAAAAIEDLHAHQRDFAAAAAASALPPAEALAAWAAGRRAEIERADALLAELRAAPQIDLAMLAVANRALRALNGP